MTTKADEDGEATMSDSFSGSCPTCGQKYVFQELPDGVFCGTEFARMLRDKVTQTMLDGAGMAVFEDKLLPPRKAWVVKGGKLMSVFELEGEG